MSEKLGGKHRIDVVVDALSVMLRQMVFRSTKGSRVAPRYRVAMYAYSDHVYDLLTGNQRRRSGSSLGVPELTTMRSTDTARGVCRSGETSSTRIARLGSLPCSAGLSYDDGEYTVCRS